MTESDVHKCLTSYGVFPMTKVLKKLEKQERFEECDAIFKAIVSYREKFHLIEDHIPTQWSQEFEDLYFSYFEKVDETEKLIAKGNLKFYIDDIKKTLQLQINIQNLFVYLHQQTSLVKIRLFKALKINT